MLTKPCTLCGRQCKIDRSTQVGYCGADETLQVALAALHHWEEPVISGSRGSGAVFFSGCSLGCIFCQNTKISHEGFGKEISQERLGEIFLELQAQGAHNINLVTPTHYLPQILRALDRVKHRLALPIVYNTSSYESPSAIKALEGYVDIYIPDLKFYSPELSGAYANAPDYFETASRNIQAMLEQVGKVTLDEDGMMTKGMILRHLVLPGGAFDSVKLLDWAAASLPLEQIYLSIMSQYTPWGEAQSHPILSRKVLPIEYNKVLSHARRLGVQGFTQGLDSAQKDYTPLFDLTGV